MILSLPQIQMDSQLHFRIEWLVLWIMRGQGRAVEINGTEKAVKRRPQLASDDDLREASE
jgi:hypothetical protein